MQLDHLVILVPELAAAVADYRELGFTVTPGGTHADGLTENALIPFRDGTYLEIIAFVDPGQPQRHRWWHFVAKGGGLIDYALQSADLQDELQALAQRGVAFDGPHDSGRARPDGVRLAWRGAFAPDRSGLPFLIEDVTERTLRVPGGAATAHSNGVQGIGRVVVGVPDIAAAADRYGAVLDQQLPRAATDAALQAAVSQAPLGPATITVAQPLAPDLPLASQIATRGPGIYAAWLVADDAGATLGWLNPQRTQQARLRIVLREEV